MSLTAAMSYIPSKGFRIVLAIKQAQLKPAKKGIQEKDRTKKGLKLAGFLFLKLSILN